MRRVRPTVRALKILPPDTFRDREQQELLRRRKFEDLDLDALNHPLLEDANLRVVKMKNATRHESASAAAGQPVWEVRSHAGAAWRGAVVNDEHGDPWLVHVDRHDRFHQTVAEVLASGGSENWMPRPIDFKLRDRQEAREAYLRWEASVYEGLVNGVAGVLGSSDARMSVDLPTSGENWAATATVSIEVDPVVVDNAGAVEHDALLQVIISFAQPEKDGLRRVIARAIALMQPDQSRIGDPAYFPGGQSIRYDMQVSYSRIISLVASSDIREEADIALRQCLTPTKLHYARAAYIAEGAVQGKAVRAVCGAWFVPSCDEGLPICPSCDERHPIAQKVLNLLRHLPQ